MLKKLAAGVLALVLSISMLSGCKNDDDSKVNSNSSSDSDSSAFDVSQLVIPEKKFVIDGEEVNTDNLVMMTINDKYDISFDEYRYYFMALIKNYNLDFSSIEDEKEREESFKTFTDLVETYIKNFYSYYVLADSQDVKFTEENEAALKEQQNADIAQYGSEENAEKYYLSQYANLEISKGFLKHDMLFDNIDSALFKEGGKFYVSQEDFLKFAETEAYAQTKHILVTFSSVAELSEEAQEGYDDLTLSQKFSLKDEAYSALTEKEQKMLQPKAKEEIEKILKKVNDGGDFDKLIKEHGWDPGTEANTEGYFITKNSSFVEQYIDASFKLKEGETSGIVESSYGYHIIKREKMNMDYVKENVETLYNAYYEEVVNSKGTELLTPIIDDMKITYADEYSKIAFDSIS